MKRKFWFLLFLFICFVSAFRSCYLSPHPFEYQVRSLLDSTGAKYDILGSSGWSIERRMFAHVKIPQSELSKVVSTLGGEKHLIVVSDNQNPCSFFLRMKYEKAFGIQQYIPYRFGFSGAILFYNQKTEEGCLFLGIAYG